MSATDRSTARSGPAIQFPEQVDSAETPSTADPFASEIEDLHRYLGRWLRGDIQNNPGGPARLQQALADTFTVVHPSGLREGKAEVIGNFASAYGEKSADYSLDVTDIAIKVLPGGYGFATYRESHAGDAGRNRLCSVLLRQRNGSGKIEWLHLHETLAPRAVV